MTVRNAMMPMAVSTRTRQVEMANPMKVNAKAKANGIAQKELVATRPRITSLAQPR